PNLLVPKLTEAVLSNKNAIKIFVCNVMTQPGETDNYTVSDHLQAIYDHVGHHLFDFVIVNDGEIPTQVQDFYAEQGAKPVEVDWDVVTCRGYKVIADTLVLSRRYLRQEADKLSQHIYQLVQNWNLRKR